MNTLEKNLCDDMNELLKADPDFEIIEFISTVLFFCGMYGPMYCYKQPTLEEIRNKEWTEEDYFDWGYRDENKEIFPVDEKNLLKILDGLMENIVDNNRYYIVEYQEFSKYEPEYEWDDELSEEENNAQAEIFFNMIQYYELDRDDWFEKILGRVWKECYRGWI